MLGGSDPKNLGGQAGKHSKLQELFWDSMTLYVVGVLVSLSAVDALTEFLRGSYVSCFSPSFRDNTEGQEDFINAYCSSSLPSTEFYPGFIFINAILIALPHYLWVNHYGGSFEYFFNQVQRLKRTRDLKTGEYSQGNAIIVHQLTQAFTTYRQNRMFTFYVVKLCIQMVITLCGYCAALVFFTDFNESYLCPRGFDNNTNTSTDPHWPFDVQVECVFTSLRLFSTIRLANLSLLTILIIGFAWSLIWCSNTHPKELGTDEVALFCFQSGIAPRYHVARYSWFSGPHIRTNLDFLVLKLFRMDSGLAHVFRENQILQKINHHNEDDQRRTNLHKRQQEMKSMGDGDLITPREIKGFKDDIVWKLSKQAGKKGIFDSEFVRLSPTDVLPIPGTLRGAILSFSSLAPRFNRALYINFGSNSLGIPSALARIFTKVGILNFNPYFETPNDPEVESFVTKTYVSDIISVMFPEDILTSERLKKNDIHGGMENIWGATKAPTDLVIVGPVENELHLTTLTLLLVEMAAIPVPHCSEGCVLLTIHPREIDDRPTDTEFHHYIPPRKLFKSYIQTIQFNSSCIDMKWPPAEQYLKDTNNTVIGSTYDLQITIGNSSSVISFGLYKYDCIP